MGVEYYRPNPTLCIYMYCILPGKIYNQGFSFSKTKLGGMVFAIHSIFQDYSERCLNIAIGRIGSTPARKQVKIHFKFDNLDASTRINLNGKYNRLTIFFK